MARQAAPADRQGELLAAVRACDARLKADPRDAVALVRRGDAKRRLGLLAEAVASFDAALAAQPGMVPALVGRGEARRAAAKHEAAEQDFTAALAAEPRAVRALTGRSAARLARRDLAGGLADLDGALRVDPGHVGARQARGEVLRKLGRHSEAVADFNAALRADPRSVLALAGRAAVCRAVGRPEDALSDYDLALRESGKLNPAVLSGRGAVKLDLGQARCALEDFNAALKLNPADEFAKWGRAMALSQRDRTPLTTVTLEGFKIQEMNVKYVERNQGEFTVNQRETFWSQDGQFFLYWDVSESRWKGTRAQDFAKVRVGGKSAFISAPLDNDILFPSSLTGWMEFDGKEWVRRKNAGIVAIGTFAAALRTVWLHGFDRAALNTSFTECRLFRQTVGDRETYWTADKQYFLFWDPSESRWKASVGGDLRKIQGGARSGLLGAPLGADLQAPEMARGWHEWDGTCWTLRPSGGLSTQPGQGAGSAAKRRRLQEPPARAGRG